MVDKICPECGKPMVVRSGKSGKQFLACSGFPVCKHCESLDEPVEGSTGGYAKSYKKAASKAVTAGESPYKTGVILSPDTVAEELKKTYDEVVAAFVEEYPETVNDPNALQAVIATVFIEKNKRLKGQ